MLGLKFFDQTRAPRPSMDTVEAGLTARLLYRLYRIYRAARTDGAARSGDAKLTPAKAAVWQDVAANCLEQKLDPFLFMDLGFEYSPTGGPPYASNLRLMTGMAVRFGDERRDELAETGGLQCAAWILPALRDTERRIRRAVMAGANTPEGVLYSTFYDLPAWTRLLLCRGSERVRERWSAQAMREIADRPVIGAGIEDMGPDAVSGLGLAVGRGMYLDGL